MGVARLPERSFLCACIVPSQELAGKPHLVVKLGVMIHGADVFPQRGNPKLGVASLLLALLDGAEVQRLRNLPTQTKQATSMIRKVSQQTPSSHTEFGDTTTAHLPVEQHNQQRTGINGVGDPGCERGVAGCRHESKPTRAAPVIMAALWQDSSFGGGITLNHTQITEKRLHLVGVEMFTQSKHEKKKVRRSSCSD